MPNLNWPDLDVDGIAIGVKDAAGNAAALPDPTTVTTTFTSSDPTVITVAADPTNPFAATGKSTGKPGTNVTISCKLSFNSGAPSITGVSQGIDVPAGPITEVDVILGTPTAPVAGSKKK